MANFGEPSFQYVWEKIKELLAGEIDLTNINVNAALSKANQAISSAGDAYSYAEEARGYADDALTASRTAQEDASDAKSAASEAQSSASEANRQAGIATDNANEAIRQAGIATDNASNAITQAGIAKTNADEAKAQASNATKYANSALDQLSVVQDVVGVLNWASQHGSFDKTTDTTIQEGKVYFVYDSVAGDYTPVVSPDESQLSTYYELTIDEDEAMESFIMSHLAVTSRGLWVLPNGINTGSVTPASGETEADAKARLGNNYKVLLSSDGMYVYDGAGVLVTTYGESITFSANRVQYIGNNNAYIIFNPANGGTLTIGGASISLGSKTLDEALTDIEATAESAKETAENTNQYFWYTQTEADAGAHITEIPQEDFLADPENGGGNLLARSNGIAVRDGLEELATFGADGSQIGKDGETHIEQDYHSFKMVNKEGYTYVHLSDLRDKNGTTTIVDTFEGDGTTKMFHLGMYASSVPSVSIDGVTTTDWTLTSDKYQITFNTAPSEGASIVVTYDTASSSARAFTFGSRNTGNIGGNSFAMGSNVRAGGYASFSEGYQTEANGAYSYAGGYSSIASGEVAHAEGVRTTASGSYSHAEGYETTASGKYSHAEGRETTASELYSHAEGRETTASASYSHAEGRKTTASGDCSHAEGNIGTKNGITQNTTANGLGSHAEGSGTIADGDSSHSEGFFTHAKGWASHAQNNSTIANRCQTAIGKYNVESGSVDTYVPTDNAFIIGNGTSDSNRSNAFAVSWDGNTHIKGDVYVGCNADSSGGVALSKKLVVEDVELADDKTVTHASYGNGSKSVAKTGYTPLGIVGMHIANATTGGTYNTWCVLHSYYLSGDTAYYIVRNTHASTDAKIKITASILYVAN